MTPESRPGVIDHPDVRRGLHKPQVDKPKGKHNHPFRNTITGIVSGAIVLTGATVGYIELRNNGFFDGNGGGPAITGTLDPTESTTSETTTTPTTTETVKPTTSQTTPTTTETVKTTTAPEPTKDLEKERILALMPDVAGFQKVIKDVNGVQKNVYIAIKGNEYGLEAGVDGGYFKEEVTFEGERVGGIAFDTKVVQKMLNKKGDLIVVPVDISEIKDKTSVDLTLSDLTNDYGTKYENCFLTINTNGKKVSVSNIIIDLEITNQVKVQPGIFPNSFKTGFMQIQGEDGKYHPNIYGNFDNSKKFQGKALFGQKLSETDDLIGVFYVKVPDAKTIESKDFLKKGNCIVFLQDIG